MNNWLNRTEYLIGIDNINKLVKLGISSKEELLDNLMLLIDLEHTLKTNNFFYLWHKY